MSKIIVNNYDVIMNLSGYATKILLYMLPIIGMWAIITGVIYRIRKLNKRKSNIYILIGIIIILPFLYCLKIVIFYYRHTGIWVLW